MAKQTKIIKTNENRHMTITARCRMSFPQLFEAKSFQNDPNQKKFYQADFIFDSEEDLKKDHKGKKKQFVSPMKAVFNAKVDQWGPDKAKWPKMQYPVFKKGDSRTNKDGEIYQGYEGKLFFSAKCNEKSKPSVVDSYGKPLTADDIGGGDYVRAHLIARPYAFGNNYGVRFILVGVQLIEKGERFGGFTKDAFDVSEDSEEAEDSFEGGGESEDGEDDF